MKRLTRRQKLFADNYILTGKVGESAKRAGYKQSHVKGSQLFKMDHIRAYIEQQTKPQEEARKMKAEEVLIYLTAVMRGEALDQFGLPPRLRDRMRAAELLLKRWKPIMDLDNKIIKKQQLELEHKRLSIEKLKSKINTLTNI